MSDQCCDVWEIRAYAILDNDNLEMWVLLAEGIQIALDGIPLAVTLGCPILLDNHFRASWDHHVAVRMHKRTRQHLLVILDMAIRLGFLQAGV